MLQHFYLYLRKKTGSFYATFYAYDGRKLFVCGHR